MANQYPKNSAGQQMLLKEHLPVFYSNQKIGDILSSIREKIHIWKTINYIYVVDRQNHLIGVFSIRDVFQKPADTMLFQIIKRQIIKVLPEIDQERVAYLALKHNLKAIPVVNKDGFLLGAVPSDQILKILHHEMREDLLKHAGIMEFEPDETIAGIEVPSQKLIKLRLPWLILGLFGGLLAAVLVESFEITLKSYIILAAFIPVMVYMADAVGAQSQILFIRGMAINHHLDLKKYFFKELKIGIIIALICGMLLSLIALSWKGLLNLGIIVGASLAATCFFAVLIALVIPLILRKINIDPAAGSGPIATLIRDILSLFIYFEIATLLLKLWGQSL